MIELTSKCFKKCIDTQYPLYTYEEESCVSKCVNNYFKGFEHIIREAEKEIDSRINQ